MAKKIVMEVTMKGKGIKSTSKNVEKTRKETDKLDRSRQRLGKSTDRYSRREKGVAQLGMNTTKSFSKMQQGIGGEGGAGGLVRAYALLAANVFALSAAFGILSRSAQVDTLIESMERLELVTGNAVKGIARELQAAASGGLDIAESMRSTSLALSAGFDTSTIIELGEVAKNAAVSLGRPIADSLDRIFRGVIKVEPELLDEIGLFVRVREAAARYASTLGIAASELTEFQKRQAFAIESIRQGQEKFDEFADIDIDAFALLAASFSDLAQAATSFLNKGLTPIITILAKNKEILGAAFAAIAFVLLRKAIPAMGLFTRSIAQQSVDASAAHAKYVQEIKTKAQVEKDAILENMALRDKAIQDEIRGAQTARRATDKARGKLGGAGLKTSKADIKASIQGEQRINALINKKKILNLSIRDTTRVSILEEQDALDREILMERELLALKQEQQLVSGREILTGGKNQLAQLTTAKLAKKEILALGMANVAATAETHGFWAALRAVKTELGLMSKSADVAKVKITLFAQALFAARGAVVALTTAISALMMRLMGFFGWMILFIPVITFFLKKLGLWSDQAGILGKATEKMTELASDFNAKMAHSGKVLADLESPTKKLQQAQLAFSRSIRDTASAIVEQAEALAKFKREATDFAFWLHGVQTSLGFGPEAKSQQAQESFFGGLIDEFEELSQQAKSIIQITSTENSRAVLALTLDRKTYTNAIKEQTKAFAVLLEHQRAERDLPERVKLFDKRTLKQQFIAHVVRAEWQKKEFALEEALTKKQEYSRDLGKAYTDSKKDLIERLRVIVGLEERLGTLAEREAAGAEVLLSIQQGAQDALREYGDQFIVKTDIDKPLATFAQTTANILADTEKMKVSDEERTLFLIAIGKENSAIFDLMSRENQLSYMINDSERSRLGILRKQKAEYDRQQKIMIQNKTTMESMAKIQKMMSKLVKEHGQFAAINLAMDKKKLEMLIEEEEMHYKNFLSQNKMTVAQFEQGLLAENRVAYLKEWLALGNTSAAFLSAENKLNKIALLQLQEKINNKTEEFKLDKAIAEIAQKRLKAIEALNQAQLTTVKLQRQVFSLQRRGTTSLSGPEAIDQIIAEEKVRLKTAERKATLEKAIIIATFEILKAEAQILEKRALLYGVEDFSVTQILKDLEQASKTLVKTVDKGLENAALAFTVKLGEALTGLNLLEGLEVPDESKRLDKQLKGLSGGGKIMKETAEKAKTLREELSGLLKEQEKLQKQLKFSKSTALEEQDSALTKQIAGTQTAIDNLDATLFVAKMQLITEAFLTFANAVKDLGPEGQVAASLAMFSANMVNTFTAIQAGFEQLEGETGPKATAERVALALQGVATVIAGMASVLSADSQAKIATIEQQIQMEKKLDGKSAQSMAKIKAMEVKKESIARKAFETNKKLQIGQAIINTAAGAAAALSVPYIGPFLAAMITVLGMAQVAIIKKTTYQGGGGSLDTVKMQQLDIGARSDRVDVTRGVTAGELSYLRGERGRGSGATNWVPGGGAVGLRQGYATGGGVLVGEQGPEIVRPTVPVTVNPNENMMGTTNVNFAIHAIDAAGLEDVLLRQRGNIIEMIREAANNTGERFLESVDTDVVGVG